MNRDRFKFRVWDGEKYFSDNVFLLPTGELGFFVNSMGNPSHRTFQHQENFTIEQCTGLTDKNGKLIYEGDIVREHFKDGGSIDKLVFYNELQCKWYTRYNFRVSLGDAAFWEFGYHISHKLEIIGTIHDAPDMKDGSKDQFRNVTKKMEE